MDRKLASIQVIDKLEAVENADTLELASVLGWKSVVKKAQFHAEDRIVYFEIDSFLPVREEFEFLRKGYYRKFEDGTEGFRVKTIRLRGQVSQGLVMPMAILPVGEYEVGQDVTSALRVFKYEPPVPKCLQGEVKGRFPSFLVKTDETRVQLLQEVLNRHVGLECYVTEKIDGCLSYRTKIATDKGDIEIGKIVNQKLPVNILTYNEDKGITEFKPIKDYHRYSAEGKKILTIGFSHKGKGNRQKYITCTDNHRFLTPNGYVEAKYLNVNDVVYHYSDKLSFEEEQVILGTLMGDASISINGNLFLVHFSHSIAQSGYFDYKMRLLKSYFTESKGAHGGFEGSLDNRRACSISNLNIKALLEKYCIRNGKKTLTKEWVEKLTPLALAIWHMDDGSLDNRDEMRQAPRISFSTHSLTYEEISLLKNMLRIKFGIESEIRTKESYKGNVLTLSKNSTEIFASLVAPYICEYMKHKIPLKYEKTTCFMESFIPVKNGGAVENKILSIQPCWKGSDNPSKTEYANSVYDLTIKDNPNYFAHRILTHNSSVTYYNRDGVFGVCSRNLDLKETVNNAFWIWARANDVEKKLASYGNISIQGELYGLGLNENSLRLHCHDVRFFNVFDIDKCKFLDFKEFQETIENMGLKTVPILDTNFKLVNDIDALVKLSIGKSAITPSVWREGIVVRPLHEVMDLGMSVSGIGNTGRLSFKIVNPEYLINVEV